MKTNSSLVKISAFMMAVLLLSACGTTAVDSNTGSESPAVVT